ncbi:MAG TPA: rod shape-determining protein RodA [Bacteroidales bacterium]|nr:rod shape-determining protein RodA [Bacteroidales bacterium]HOX79241.1 rod shape-determining protein RodA [Bacteroidales bacterium]HPI86180.1 rod shape-determining protein RodA [Bacteroidales bacterium]
MTPATKNIYGKIDWTTVWLYIILVLMGWVSVYSSVYDETHSSILDISQRYGKQMIWIIAGGVIAFVIMLTDAKVFNAFAYIIYGISILILIAVLLIGTEISGSKSWFQIGSVAIQPAEFAKFATCLALARYLSSYATDMNVLQTKIVATALIFTPALLIFLQNDTGSAVVYIALILVLYREGLSGYFLISGVIMVVLFVMTLLINQYIMTGILSVLAVLLYYYNKLLRKRWWIIIGIWLASVAMVFAVDYVFDNFLEEHQKTRINVLLGKESDPKGAGYNVNQSKIAIGSGGLIGKGFLQGTQTKYNFVPEQSTDFIFCTVGEEWGFLGSTAVIGLFVYLLFRLVRMAERQRSDFSRIYGYGVISILFFHFVVNIGMTIGLVPVIGIPLPFFSYGGSSLWAFTILLFIFIKLDANRLALF